MNTIDRRHFIRQSVYAGVIISAQNGIRRVLADETSVPDVVTVKNGDPAQLVRSAVEGLGGMSRFVKNGQNVLLKPNIGWASLPQQAADTNPEAVAEVVKMCLEAGAKKVRVLDNTTNPARRCYKMSGIEEAANNAGAEVRHIVPARFTEVKIPQGELVRSWPFYRDALEFDVLINMPVAKHHTMSGLTLGFKNVMGLIGGERGDIHTDFMTKIVDLNMAVEPALTIIDAFRIMVRNGPSGGNLADVEERKTVIAGVDRVAVDVSAAGLFDIDVSELTYLKIAHERGLGQIDLNAVNVRHLDLSS